MKQDLMNNAIYNEYNLDELETSFRYVSSSLKNDTLQFAKNNNSIQTDQQIKKKI